MFLNSFIEQKFIKADAFSVSESFMGYKKIKAEKKREKSNFFYIIKFGMVPIRANHSTKTKHITPHPPSPSYLKQYQDQKFIFQETISLALQDVMFRRKT
jgi:hypothetical protein